MPSIPIVHAPCTGNFRCTCGSRLAFGSGSHAITLLICQRRLHGRKIGVCPRCGQPHIVPFNSGERSLWQRNASD